MDARAVGKQKQRTDEVDSDAPPPTVAEAEDPSTLSPAAMETGGFSFPGTPPRLQAPADAAPSPSASTLLAGRLSEDQDKTDPNNPTSSAPAATTEVDTETNLDELTRAVKAALALQPESGSRGWSPIRADTGAGETTEVDTGAETAEVDPGERVAFPSAVDLGDGWYAYGNGEDDNGFLGAETGASKSEFKAESSAVGAEQDETAASSAQLGHGLHHPVHDGPNHLADHDAELPPMGGQGYIAADPYHGALISYPSVPNWAPPIPYYADHYWVPVPAPYFTVPYCHWPQPMGWPDPFAASSSAAVPYQSSGSGGGKLTRYKQGDRKNKLCYCWTRTGACRYGDRCSFVHVDHRPHQIPICDYVRAGLPCPYGYACRYHH